MTEPQLLLILTQHPEKGQKLLYDQFVHGFFRICLRYCDNTQDAEEVLLNGFMKIFKFIASFHYQEEGSLKAWMKRIMINEALMFLRRKKIRFTEFDFAQHDFEASLSPDQELEAEELFDLIKELPPGYRTVFNLYVIEGYTHKEISESLNININTSKSQLNKARNYLKKRLQELAYEIRSI